MFISLGTNPQCMAPQLEETCLNEVTFNVGAVPEFALIEPDCPVSEELDAVVPVTCIV